jgi:hypothetical protein
MSNNKSINNPEIYKNKWLKFDKTLLYPMSINDCNDTIDGICFKNLTLDQCMDKCTNDCDVGYHVQIGDKESICVPLLSKNIIPINPSYRLEHQDIYNFKDNVNITFFQDKDKYPYPPDTTSIVFYKNILDIRSYNDKDLYMQVNINKKNSLIRMGKNGGTNINLLPKYSNNFVDNWEAVQYNTNLSINIPQTSLTMRVTTVHHKVKFEILDPNLDNTNELHTSRLFYFEPKDPKLKGNVKWFEPIYIKSLENRYLVIDYDINIIRLSKNNTEKSLFCLVPQLIPHYCENNVCKSTSFEDIYIDETTNSLKIKDSNGNLKKIYFNDNCWNQCTQIENSLQALKTENPIINTNKNVYKIVSIIIAVVLVLVILILVIKSHV